MYNMYTDHIIKQETMHTERIQYDSSTEFLACRPADSNAGAARVLVRQAFETLRFLLPPAWF